MTTRIEYVYGVHAVRLGRIGETRVVFSGRTDAERHAEAMSGDPGVVAASVTEYALDEPGRRTPVAMFVHGTRQAVGYVSDDRTIFAGSREPGWVRA